MIGSRSRRPGMRWRSPGSSSPTSIVSCSPTRRRSRAQRSRRRRTSSTRARWRGCSRRGFCRRCGRRTSRRVSLRRRISRRAQLVRQRTREKNQVHAILIRNLKGRSSATDLFGAAGRRWLAAQELPADEREIVEACLRGIDFLDREVATIDRALAELVLGSPELRRLMTLPGVNFVTACALLAAIGEIGRFPTARQLVGLPRPRPAGAPVGLGAGPARPDLKQGPGETRHVLVEAAWHAARTTGPLRALP